jgi:PAS domain-containing protein
MHNTAGTFFMPVVHNHPQQQAQSQPQPQQQSQQQQQANAGMIPRRNTYAPGVMASGAGMELYHPPTDEEIDAILQTYGRPGAQRDVNGSQAGASGGHLDPAAAAAAAAAYGHLGYDGERSQGGAGPVDMRLQRLGGNRGPGGYEGDFSNTPSSQTPGGTSSDDSPGGKRRRMTFTAGAHPLPSVTAGQVLQQHEQQGSSMAPQHVRPSMPHSATNMIDAAAAAEYGGWAPNLHRRTLSGSLHVPPSRSSESLMDGYQPMHAPSDNVSGPQRPGHQQQQSWAGPQRNSSSGNMPGSSGGPLPLGHAASHPPGLGSQVLRGPDRASLGHNAASDFTKRKGWSNRIVEELLDFVHVLDAQGRVLFASPSVYALTGWKPEELTGKPLFEVRWTWDLSRPVC